MSTVQLEVYLFFTGNCREAMEFYKSVFGGELFMQSFSDAPGKVPGSTPEMSNRIMHASLKGGEINLMASDSTRTEPYGTSSISLSLGGSDETKLRQIFDQLSEGGKVTSQLKKEFWGDIYGSLTDKFGIDWIVNIGQDKSEEKSTSS